MTNRWLRNRVDGTIYGWDPYLAANPKCEEVTEEQAFPERFRPAGVIARMEAPPTEEAVADAMAVLSAGVSEPPKLHKGRKRKHVDLHTDDIPPEPQYTNTALNDEVTRGLG